MLRLSRGLAAGIVVGAALLGDAGQAPAQTASTTTTSSTTTTTTVPPHPFSDATRDCLRTAHRNLKACHRAGTGAACRPQFETAYANCFKAGAGVTCAKRCVTRETTCFANAPTTQKTCGSTCLKTRRRDVQACRRIAEGNNVWAGGDAACLATADANYHLCKFVCAQTTLDCRTSRKFCVANCANL